MMCLIRSFEEEPVHDGPATLTIEPAPELDIIKAHGICEDTLYGWPTLF